MTDVFVNLDEPIWRGFSFPITERSVSFVQGTAKHRIQYKDGQPLESIGTENRIWRYSIPMREAVRENLFAVTGPFMDACRDRSDGTLIDPVHGFVNAKCINYDEVLTASMRDGVDVTVQFEESPLPDEREETDRTETPEDVRTGASALDGQVELIDFEQYETPEPTVNPLDAISGAGAQINRQGNRASAALEDTAFRLKKVEDQLNLLKDPNNEPVRRSARKLRIQSTDLARSASDVRGTVESITTKNERSIFALAKELRITVDEFRQLNPLLAGEPRVPAGSKVNYYRKENTNSNG